MESDEKSLLDDILADSNAVSLCSEESDSSIDFHGRIYTPSETKGFIRFKMSHGFPVVTLVGQAIHPNVVAKSFLSLKYENLNFEHQIIAYNPRTVSTEKIWGTVVDVHFPNEPGGGWKINSDKTKSPFIEGIASFAKKARGADRVIGRHQTGRHKFSVSMELDYKLAECGVAVSLNGKKPTLTDDSPQDFLDAGWEYLPITQCSKDLFACIKKKGNSLVPVADYKNRRVVVLVGGLDAPIRYTGVGIVEVGAEKEAEILQMAASARPLDLVSRILAPLSSLAELLKK